jgi:transcriptional regulator with XRE-family HTH domain
MQVIDKLAYMTRAIEHIGDRIRRCRKQAGLTQAEIGEAAGVSQAAVVQWETGETKTLRAEHLLKIALKLKKSPHWLQTGKGEENPQRDIGGAIEALPDNGGQMILDFLQYRFEKAEGFIASDKIAHYLAMIEDFKRDLAARKKQG